jgi:lysophospholipase L1-like esterase
MTQLRHFAAAAIIVGAGCTAPSDGGSPDAAIDAAIPSSSDLAVNDLAPPANDLAPPAWMGTWAAAPQSLGDSFNQQTLRQIVRTSIAGTAARVRLSNVFGNQPLVIADAHLAVVAKAPMLVAGSDRALTFAGQSMVTIPVGGDVVSDAVAFSIPALADVAVSFYLPQATGAGTGHQLGLQTSYVADGDVSGNVDWSGNQTGGSYHFLTAVEVQNPAAVGALVTLGASITDGYGSAQDDNRRWPNDLAMRLAGAGHIVGVLNEGISGNDLLQDGAGQSALHRFMRDVVAQPGVRWVIFSDDPINDLGGGNPPTSDQLIAGLKQLIAAAHANGIRFLCSTLTPYEGAGYWTPTGEMGREAINAFIRGPSSGCDGIVDQDQATHDPAHPTKYLPAYDSGDHLHPNEAGLQAIAAAVDLSLLAP